MTTNAATLSRRQKTPGQNHHLWNNNGHYWWFHGTLHLPDGTARRIRLSLRTRDLTMARSLRDKILTHTTHQ